jgi:hypothetical protein
LRYVLFSGLSWILVQNTWIRPENTSRAIWSFSEFEADPEKMKNRPRHFDRSIICTANNSIDRLSVDSTSFGLDAIDRFSEQHIFDRSTFDWSTFIRSIDFASSRRSRYFQIFMRSKSKIEFYGQKWTATSSEYLARINSCSLFVNPISYIYGIRI